MTQAKAPSGGAISNVNGQFYEGGEFMPESGMFCGAKKQARKWAKTPAKWRKITITSRLFVTATEIGSTRDFYLSKKPFVTRDEANAFVAEVLRLRAQEANAAGMMAHPTEIVAE